VLNFTVILLPTQFTLVIIRDYASDSMTELIPCHINTANQNSGKPLYIRRYSTQPSHRAFRILFPPKFRKAAPYTLNIITLVDMHSCILCHKLKKTILNVFYAAVFAKRQDRLTAG